MATTNYPSNLGLAERAAHTLMQEAEEAGKTDLGWLERFEQLDERKLFDCFDLAMSAPSDFLRGYLLAKASTATAMGTT